MTDRILLRVEDLRVHFKLKHSHLFGPRPTLYAVDGASFEISRGRTLGLVGESGCGKTTSGLAVLRLVEPTGGKVYFDGIDLLALEAEVLRTMRRRMQIIFQDPYSSLNSRQTAGGIVRDPLDIQNIGSRSEREARVSELFHLVGLMPNQKALFPHQFSGGQRQRICIARALALNPDFIVCDEPVSALDVAIQAQILNLLCKLQDELNLTYLFISHDLAVVQHISDEIAVMYLGNIVEKTDRRQLFKNPLHPYTRALLSAVPSRDSSKKKSTRIRLKGDIPNPINRPKGCHFHTRCMHAKAHCKIKEPKLVEKLPGHWVACHFETSDLNHMEDYL
ncbi:MAG: ATP-binding cassette domain-containing protein [Deltaproteobacteria bacterium]|nr:ATP-binding cassette domain-containing protein [Deltaproteobacteria bacterium]MBW2153956.1 ATP-binding cassette domain-containing protein [Deltaproteobacteria bacterium]